MRIYDGCPDSTLQAKLEYVAKRLKVLKKRHPEAHLTFHPSPGFWVAHIWGKPLSGEHWEKIHAIEEAIRQ